MNRKTIHVVAAIIHSGGRIFATQRGYGDYKGWWEFPGGKVEPDESPEEALVREIKEELDTVISVEGFLMTVEYDYPEFHLSMDCYRCLVESGKLTLLEHEASKWLTLVELPEVKWLPADRIVVNALLDGKDEALAKQRKERRQKETREAKPMAYAEWLKKKQLEAEKKKMKKAFVYAIFPFLEYIPLYWVVIAIVCAIILLLGLFI